MQVSTKMALCVPECTRAFDVMMESPKQTQTDNPFILFQMKEEEEEEEFEHYPKQILLHSSHVSDRYLTEG
jgi:hypothetical protein